MKRRLIYTQQMLERVADFGDIHAKRFPEQTDAQTLLASIHSAVEKLSGHASGQVSGFGAVRNSFQSKLAAREDLQLQLELMHRTARALKLKKFFMPRNRSDAALIAAGESFIAEAEALKEQFIKQGLPAKFIENLTAAVQDFKRAVLDEVNSTGKRKGTVVDFEDTLRTALDDVRRFDALVENTLRDDPGLMTEWHNARRVGRPPVAKKPEPQAKPTQEAPA